MCVWFCVLAHSTSLTTSLVFLTDTCAADKHSVEHAMRVNPTMPELGTTSAKVVAGAAWAAGITLVASSFYHLGWRNTYMGACRSGSCLSAQFQRVASH